QLQPRLLKMIEIEMRVAQCMNELAGLVAGHLTNRQREQRIRGDVERDAEKDIGRPLVELTGEMVFRDIELEQAMARRQRHPVDVGGVPGGDNQAPGIRTAADGLDDAGNLVNSVTVRPGPGAPL